MPDYKILIYGYGNPGRQDDGLGNEFVEKMEKWSESQGLKGIEFDSNYQLNIEDAAAIADKDLVIFVDASIEDIDNYLMTKVTEETAITFTTHAASPGYVVKLCRELYGRSPAVFLLHIKGYEWAFTEGLTDKATENLMEAIKYVQHRMIHTEVLLNEYGLI